MTMTKSPTQPIASERHRPNRRRIPLAAILITALSQGFLVASVAIGGNLLVGVMAAVGLAICGVMMVLAATTQR